MKLLSKVQLSSAGFNDITIPKPGYNTSLQVSAPDGLFLSFMDSHSAQNVTL